MRSDHIVSASDSKIEDKSASQRSERRIPLDGVCDAKNMANNTVPNVLHSRHRSDSSEPMIDGSSYHFPCSMNSPSLRPSPGKLPGSRKRRAYGSNGPLCDPEPQEMGPSSPLTAFVDRSAEIGTVRSQNVSGHHPQSHSRQPQAFLSVPSTPTNPFSRGSPDAVQQKTPSSALVLTPSPSPTVEKLAMFEKLTIQSPIISNSPGSSFKVVSSHNNTPGSESGRNVAYPNGARLPARRQPTSPSPRQVPLTVLSSSSDKKPSMIPHSPSLKPRDDKESIPFFLEAQPSSRAYLSPRWKKQVPGSSSHNISSPRRGLVNFPTNAPMKRRENAVGPTYSKTELPRPIAYDMRFTDPQELQSKISPLKLGPPTEVDCSQGPNASIRNMLCNPSTSLLHPSPVMDPRDEFRAFANIPSCDDSLTDSDDDDGDWFFLSDPGDCSIRNKNSGTARCGKKSRQMTSSTITASTAATTSTSTSTSNHQVPIDLPVAPKSMMMPPSLLSRKDTFLPILNPPHITSACSGSRLSSNNSLFGMSIIHEKPFALEAPSHQQSSEWQDGGAFTFGSSGFPPIGVGPTTTCSAVKRTSSESSFGFSSKRTSSEISLGLGLEKAPYLTECSSRDMITPPVIASVPQNPPPLKQKKFNTH